MNLGYIKKRSLALLDSDYYVPHRNKYRFFSKFIVLTTFSLTVLFIRIYFLSFFGGYRNTYILFYPTLVLCALGGGLIPGVTSTLIFAVGALYFLLPPYNTFLISNWEDKIAIIIFILGGFFISVICEALQREQHRSFIKTKKLRKVGEELNKARNELQTILENVADGIIVRDGTGRPVYANHTALKLYGYEGKRNKFYTLRELDKNFEIINEEGKSLSSKNMPIGRVLGGAKEAEEVLCFRNRMTNKEFWCISRVRGIYDSNKNLQLVVVVFADITERRRLDRQKDEFIGIASHELKTPVTSLKGYVQVLHTRFKKKGDEESATFMNKMNSQINKLTLLIQDLLDVTKIEKGKLQFHEDYFDFNTLVHEIAEEMQRTTDTHIIQIESEETAQIYGDRDRIGQVMINFLSNAIKYSPKSNKIEVKSHLNAQNIIYSVKDFGIGISQKHKDKIFERFFRVNENKQETFPGIGLGLYISSEIVKRHHGKLWMESSIPLKRPTKVI